MTTKGYLEVGRALDESGDRFILVPESHTEPITKPLSRDRCQLIRFSENLLPWLIDALMAEAGIETFHRGDGGCEEIESEKWRESE